MYILLILFFASLLSITFMIGRKLLLLQDGQVFQEKKILEAPYLEEWKHLTLQNVKKYSYHGLVITIRMYVKSSTFLKSKWLDLKEKIKTILSKNSGGGIIEKKEVSKFLKMVGDYKQKIRKIKHRIKEEESL